MEMDSESTMMEWVIEVTCFFCEKTNSERQWQMLRNKYAKDYRIVAYDGAKGKLKEKAVYIGPLYCFSDVQRLRILALRESALALVSMVLLLFSLWNYSAVTRQIYVTVPVLALFAVVYLFFSSAMSLLKLTTQFSFKKEEKEKSFDRAKESSIAGIIVSSLGFLAALVYGIKVSFRFSFWDFFYLTSMGLQILFFAVGFFFTRGIQVTEIENPEADEKKETI